MMNAIITFVALVALSACSFHAGRCFVLAKIYDIMTKALHEPSLKYRDIEFQRGVLWIVEYIGDILKGEKV